MIDIPGLLITDDDAAMRETLRCVFEPRGYRTLLAADGAEALRVIERQPVHVLLVDMHMPNLTGLETVRRLRASHIELPFILMSARLDPLTVNEAEKEQAFSVVPKPFSIRSIVSLVADALRRTYNWPTNA